MDIRTINAHIERASIYQSALSRANNQPDRLANVHIDGEMKTLTVDQLGKLVDEENAKARQAAQF